jgi:hypothetical protein
MGMRFFVAVMVLMLSTMEASAQIPVRSPEGTRLLWGDMTPREQGYYIEGYLGGFDVALDIPADARMIERRDGYEPFLKLMRDDRPRLITAMAEVIADSSLYIPSFERALQFAAARMLMTPERLIRCNSDLDRLVRGVADAAREGRTAEEQLANFERLRMARRACPELPTR